MALATDDRAGLKSPQSKKTQLLLKAAIVRHKKLEFEAAKLIYEEVQKSDPCNIMCWQLSGLLCCQMKDYEKSIELLSRAIALEPVHEDSYYHRAISYQELGYLEQSFDDYSSALSINRENFHALNNRGNVLKDLGRLDEALSDLDLALVVKPNYASAYNNRGIVLKKLGHIDKALMDYSRALSLEPHYAEAFYNRAKAFQDMGQPENALADYNKAISLKTNYSAALNNRGLVLKELLRFDEAIGDLNESLNINPDDHEAYNNLGLVLRELRHFDDALKALNKALSLEPNYSKGLNNRGNILQDLMRFDEAMINYEQAISLTPESAEAFNNRFLALKELGRFDEAMADLNKAIALDPTYPEAHWNKALQLLLFGEFEEGWPLFDWRWKTKQHIGTELTTSKPQWSGEANKRVFLWAEQGIGDEIMYASLIPELAASSSKLIVQCDERLIPLFKRSFIDGIEYRCRKSPAPEDSYDCHIPMGSLPNIFRPSLDSFSKASKAYLHCESERSQELRKTLLKGEAKTLIGISWNSSSPIAGAHHRNITLSDMAQHLDAPNVQLVNLQYGDVSDEIAKLKEDHGIEVAEVSEIDNRNDIDGLAALIMACDQIVSIDNATVHLAGALGANTKVLLPFNRSWQWGLDRSDSYWYGSLQLHRQKNYGDWKHVLKTIK
jgi:tetratricopeptide (TPR) repeat protein